MPTPGRPVDEERVVGVAGELGHGQGGGVGEAVGVADDELLEGQRWVDPVVLGAHAAPATLASAAPGAGAALGGGARAHVDGDLGAEDRRRRWPAARARSARPPTSRSSSGASTTSTSPSSAERPQGREPDVVHVSRDRLAQLVLDGAPDVLGVLGHDRGSRLLGRQRSAADGGGGRPGGDRRGDYSNGSRARTRGPSEASGRTSQIANKTAARAVHTPVHGVCTGVSTASAR